LRSPSGDLTKIAQAGKRGFKGEAIAPTSAEGDFLQHQTTGPDRGGLGRKRCKACRDLICIDETRQTGFDG
jgi:hypothetical protein